MITVFDLPQGLKLAGLGDSIDIYIKELPVSYKTTQEIIAKLWHTLKPKVEVRALWTH